MKKTLFILFCMLAAVVLSSCDKATQTNGEYWGKQVRYSNFLWSKYTPDTIKQTLKFDVGEVSFTKPIILGLFETILVKDEKTGEFNEVERAVGNDIELFMNGQRCNGSTFTVLPGDKEITLGVVFTEDAKSGDYYWNLKVIDAGDLDMINEELTSMSIPVLIRWKADFDTKINPLAKAIIWCCIIVFTLLLIWFILLRRIIFPTFAFDNLQVAYFEGDSRKGREDLTLRGARMVICDANARSQGKLNQIFCGRVEFLTNPFWTNCVKLTPCGSDGISTEEDTLNGSSYKMASTISSQNGPKRPFIVKKNKSEQTAHISIG